MTLASRSDSATEIVEREFGITLKSHQSRAIEALCDDKDVILHVPTGGGKSVVFQGASRVLMDEGITVVVYPLRALIEDQQISAEKFGVNCIRYYGDVNAKDRVAFLERIKHDHSISMVLTVPEMLLASRALRDAIKSRGTALLAIDEAHVYDEWALSFRSSYLKMERVVRELSAKRLLLCSATLTAQGAIQAAKVFKRYNWKVIQVPAIRPNLKFKSTRRSPTDFLREAVKTGQSPSASPAIAFFTWKSTTGQIAAKVEKSAERRVLVYHADLRDSERKAIQAEWTVGREWVFATKAFGMGIDKANVRTIFHVQLPTSILDYAQEVGRAGRDGADSYCYLPLEEPLTNGRTGCLGEAASFLVSKNYPAIREIRRVWDVLHSHLKGKPGWHKVDPRRLATHLYKKEREAPTVRKCIAWLSIAELLKKKQYSSDWIFDVTTPPTDAPTGTKTVRVFHSVMDAIREHGRFAEGSIIMTTGQLEDFVAPVSGVKDWKSRLKRWHNDGFIKCQWPGAQSTCVQIVSNSFNDFAETGKILEEARRIANVNLQKVIALVRAPEEDRAEMIERAISLDIVVFEAGMAELRKTASGTK